MHYKCLIAGLVVSFLLGSSQIIAVDLAFLNEFNAAKVNTGETNPLNLLNRPKYGLKNILHFDEKQTLFKGDFILNGRLYANHNRILSSFNNIEETTSEYSVDINELFYNHFGDTYLVSIGRKKVKWGVGYVSSPTDIVSPPTSPDDPNDRLYSLQGSDLVQLTLYGNDSQLDFFALPLSEHNKGFIESPAIAARFYKFIAPFDVSLVTRVQENKDTLFGFNNSIAIGDSLELHSDYTWQLSNHLLYPKDMGGTVSLESRSEPVSRILLGGQWSPNQKWNFVFEYFHFTDGFSNNEWDDYQSMLGQLNLTLNNVLTKDAAVSSFNGFSSRSQFPLRQNYLFSRILRNKIASKLDFELIVLLGLDDGSYIQQSTLSLQASSLVKMYVRALNAAGSDKSEFSQFPNNYQILAGMKIKI
tara:strand:- start:3063 stop:4310 length:1248 start_codon:yes stop_codon:yes gene_type:complete